MDVYIKVTNEWTSLEGATYFNEKDEAQGALSLPAGKEYIIEVQSCGGGNTPSIYIYQGEKPDNDSTALGSFLSRADGQATLGIGASETWVRNYFPDVPTKLNILGV